MTTAETNFTHKLDKEIASIIKRFRRDKNSTSLIENLTYSDFFSNKMLMIQVIREGVPYSFFNLIRHHTPFTENDWANFLDISTKSLQRYKQTAKQFKPIQSEKIIELAEVTNVGLDVFGDMEKFKLWLDTPNFSLGNFKPIELLKDSYGKEMVIGELTRINHGIFCLMEVYRLSRQKFAGSLSGKGAALKGARWNSAGVELIYTAANRSLAMAEVAVHFTLATLPRDYIIMAIFVPDDISMQKLNISDLPAAWNVFPHPTSTQAIGDKFVLDNK